MAPITIVAAGFAPHVRVFVEQCDGIPPTTPQWTPTLNCDLASSPSGRLAGGDGSVTFPANDLNFAFRPFRGQSPQGLFNCLGPHQQSPHNGLYDSRSCTVRVSTNNSSSTSDQAFLVLVLPDYVAVHQSPSPGSAQPPPATSSANATNPTGTSSQASETAPTGGPPSGASAATTPHNGGGHLAFTGAQTALLIAIALECLAFGLALRGRRRVSATRRG
jgi:hypothetical protein